MLWVRNLIIHAYVRVTVRVGCDVTWEVCLLHVCTEVLVIISN